MKTNCERCCKEIEDDEVQKCEECGYDGLCPDCMGDHICESLDVDAASTGDGSTAAEGEDAE